AHRAERLSCGRAVIPSAAATRRLSLPAKFHLAAHLGSRRDGQRFSTQVSDEYARRLQFHLGGGVDISFELSRDSDLIGTDTSSQHRSFLDREIALNMNIALELARNANVAGAFDLSFDTDFFGDERLLRATGGGRRTRSVVS